MESPKEYAGAPIAPNAGQPFSDLLLADLDHFEESIWRNEEIGEKRFEFFTTLATAVGGGLVALWTSARATGPSLSPLTTATTIALVALLLFALITYGRMIHRDRVTEEYKRETRKIRKLYRQTFPGLGEYTLHSERNAAKNAKCSDLKYRWGRIKQMGYTQTVAVINGILLAILLRWSHVRFDRALLGGIALGIALCFHGAQRHTADDEKTS